MPVIKKILFTLGLMAAVATAHRAMAFQGAPEVITNISAEEASTILDSLGWQPEILFDDDGQKNDFIRIKVGAINSFVKMMDCTGTTLRRCNSLLFFANFDLGARVTSEHTRLLNSYNDRNPVGRAYYISRPDEPGDEVGVDLHVRLHGGVTVAHLEQETSQWQGVINTFLGMFNQQ